MCHQFPWLPDCCVALGLALHEHLIGRGTSPSKTKDRTLIIQVSCGNCIGGGTVIFFLILIKSITTEVLSVLRAPTEMSGQNSLSSTVVKGILNMTCVIAILQWPCFSYRAWLSKFVSGAFARSEE